MTTQLKSISEITPVQAFEIVKTLTAVQMEIMVTPEEWVTISDKVIAEKMNDLGVNIHPSQGNLCFSLSYIYDREMTDALMVKWLSFLDRMKVDPEFRAALQEAAKAQMDLDDDEDLETVFEVIDDQIAELKSIQYMYMTALRGMYN